MSEVVLSEESHQGGYPWKILASGPGLRLMAAAWVVKLVAIGAPQGSTSINKRHGVEPS